MKTKIMKLEPKISPLYQAICHIGPKGIRSGAADRARTGDLFLGKETFYQLNYTRSSNIAFSLHPFAIRELIPASINVFLLKFAKANFWKLPYVKGFDLILTSTQDYSKNLQFVKIWVIL